MNASRQTTPTPPAAVNDSIPGQRRSPSIGYLSTWLADGAEPRDHRPTAPVKARKSPITASSAVTLEASSAHFNAIMAALATAEANISRIRSPRCRWEVIQGVERLLQAVMAEPLGDR